MGALIFPFVRICLLRMKPQDLPSSTTLLGLVLLTHTVVGVTIAGVNLRFGQALAAGVIDTALLAGLTTGLLMSCNLRARAVQTMSALAGAGTIIGFLAFPVSIWLHDAHQARVQSPILSLLLLAMLGWSLLVSSHVFRHALSAPFYVGVLVSIAFYWISVKILGGLFPLSG